MKKLNRKGFTLVELLAVIVILAIVVGITMMTILPTIDNSRKKSFDVAVDTIKTYIREQHEMSMLGPSFSADASSYNEAVATNNTGDGNTGNLLEVTGYKNNIKAIRWRIENGATAQGDYRQSSTYSVCQ